MGPYPDFESCVLDQKDKGHDDESARAICGEIKKKTEDGRASLALHGRVRVDFRGAGSESLELDLYDGIGSDPLFGGGISAKQVYDKLAENGKAKKILVRLNSAGGIVTEGLAIYNLLKNSKAEVTCRVDGLAGSIASVIAMAGRLEMPATSYLMIHNPFGWVEGGADDLRHQAEVLDSMREMMLDIYCAKSGRSRDLIGSLMDQETWLSGTEAMAYGLADSLIPTPNAKLAAHFDLSRYRNTPRSVDSYRAHILVPDDGDPVVAPSIDATFAALIQNSTTTTTLSAESAAVLTPPQAAEQPPEKAADNTAAPGASPMDEQVYKDKIAELEATVAALKAELDGAKSAQAKAEADAAEAKAKFTKKDDDGDDDDDDEDEKAKAAVVEHVQSITGHKDISGLVGALEAHLTKLAATKSARTVESRIKALRDAGRITPAQAKAFKNFSVADLDVFEKSIGDARILAIGSEHTPNDDDESVKAARAAATPPVTAFNPETVTLTADERAFCKNNTALGVKTSEFEAKFLADKRERARIEWEKARGNAA